MESRVTKCGLPRLGSDDSLSAEEERPTERRSVQLVESTCMGKKHAEESGGASCPPQLKYVSREANE